MIAIAETPNPGDHALMPPLDECPKYCIDRVASLETRIQELESRLRAVEISIAKMSVYVGIAAVVGSVAGSAFLKMIGGN